MAGDQLPPDDADPESAALPADPDGLCSLLRDPLIALAQHRFSIPEEEAARIVHDVFVSFLPVAATIRKPREWLISGLFNGCRYYWRCRAREAPLPDDLATWEDPAYTDLEDRLLTQITIDDTLAQLDPRCREVLGLRFVEDRKFHEIADVLAQTTTQVAKTFYRCLERARTIYHLLMGTANG